MSRNNALKLVNIQIAASLLALAVVASCATGATIKRVPALSALTIQWTVPGKSNVHAVVPVADVKSYFESQGLPAPAVPSSSICDPDGGDGGDGNPTGAPPEPAPPPPPPDNDPAVAPTLQTVDVTGHYSNGWEIMQQYVRSVQSNGSGGWIDGPWSKGPNHTSHWTPPKSGTPEEDCDEDPA